MNNQDVTHENQILKQSSGYYSTQL